MGGDPPEGMNETTSESRDWDRIRLSRAEAWVCHDVTTARLIDAEERGDAKPWWAISITLTLESDRWTLTTFEAWRLQRVLADYANDPHTPAEDASIARAVADRLESTFESPPSTLRLDGSDRTVESR